MTLQRIVTSIFITISLMLTACGSAASSVQTGPGMDAVGSVSPASCFDLGVRYVICNTYAYVVSIGRWTQGDISIWTVLGERSWEKVYTQEIVPGSHYYRPGGDALGLVLWLDENYVLHVGLEEPLSYAAVFEGDTPPPFPDDWRPRPLTQDLNS